MQSVFHLDVAADKNAVFAWGDNYNGQSTVPPGLGNVVAIAAGWTSYALRSDGTVVVFPTFGPLTAPVATNVVAITAGTHVLALKTDGSIAAAGSNFYGQLNPPAGLGAVAAVAAGYDFSLALRPDGTVVGWGLGDNGQTVVPAGTNNFVAIAAGGAHGLGLRADGTVAAWGSNSSGQTAVPVGLNDVVAIAAGGSHSVALRRDGTVVAWGSNSSGQAAVPSGLNNVIRISAGGEHTLALKADGTPVAWGQTYPFGAGAVPSLLGLANVRAIAAGSAHSLVMVPAIAPQIITQPASQAIAAGAATQISVAVSGTRPLSYIWKKNGVLVSATSGRISNETTANLVLTAVEAADAGSYTVEISNAAGTVTSNPAVLAITPPPVFSVRPLSRRVQVGLSATFTAAASGNGAVTYQWRRNGMPLPGATDSSFTINPVTFAHRGPYELVVTDAVGGIARSVFYIHPTSFNVARAEVLAWGNWSTSLVYPPFAIRDPIAVSAGKRLNVALQSDGTVAQWGEDYFNQAGVPEGLSQVIAVSAGAEHALALKADGTVVAFGSGYSSQTSVPAGLRDVVAVAGGDSYSVALRADGTLVEWGSWYVLPLPDSASVGGVIAVAANAGGVLALRADGTVAPLRAALAAPPPVGLNGVTAVAVGEQHYLALKSDGTVVGWGSGSAATVPTGLSNVVEIAAGAKHSLALKADGSLVTWGDNAYAQTTVPAGASPAITASGGNYHSVALVRATAPAIVTPPGGQTAVAGSTVSFSVGVVGVAPISYQWIKDGSPIAGATSVTFTLASVQLASAGAYSVKVTDPSGTATSPAARLTVLANNAPPNDAFSAAQSLPGTSGSANGQNVGATGEPGEPAHSYSYPDSANSSVWFSWTASANGLIRFSTSGSDFVTAIAAYTGSTVDSLTLVQRNTAFAAGSDNSVGVFAHAGTTYRIAIASGTSARGSFVLGWQFFPAPANDDFANATVLSGNSGAINGNDSYATPEPGEPLTSGYYSSLWYAWTAAANGKATFRTSQLNFAEVLRVYSGSSLAGTLLGESQGYPGFGSATVTVDVTAGTTYRISVGSVYDNRGTFTLNWEFQGPPAITTQPAAQTASLGGSASFNVIATGSGLNYQWYHDGIKVAGGTAASLSLTNLQRSDAGLYHVVVSNLVGSVPSSPASLLGPNAAPGITTQPLNSTVTAGQTAVLSVSATGAGPLAYQWRRNGVMLAGATAATLTIGSASRGDADSYDVFVYDGLSRTLSARARLDVAPTVYPGLQRFGPAPYQPLGDLASVWALAPAPGGKFFIAGDFDVVDGRPRSHVARFNADGSLDSSFAPPVISGNVRLLVPTAGGGVFIGGDFYGVDLRPRLMLAKLDASGALDFSFAPATLNGNIFAIAADASGRLLVCGSLAENGLARNIYRLQADGSLDPTFQGSVSYSASAVVVQADGKILVGGAFDFIGAVGGQLNRRGVGRLNADGSADPTFDANSWLGSGGATSLALLPDGSMVAGGGFTTNTGTRAVVRLTANGGLDGSFTADSGIQTGTMSIGVQSSGKLIVRDGAGTVRRLNGNGTLDASFVARSSLAMSYQSAIEADGRILLGLAGSSSNTATRLQRLTVDGAPDPSVIAVPRITGTLTHLAALPGGKLLVAGGFTAFGPMSAGGLARLNADGSPDSSYAAPPASSSIVGLYPLPDGGAYVFYYYDSIRRHRADGSLDTTFATPAGAYAGVPALATLLPGARLLVAAGTWPGITSPRLVVMNADGSRDTTFDAGAGVDISQIKALAAQPDGRMLVGGTFISFNGVARNRLVRLTAMGAIDPTFNVGTGADGTVETIAVLGDGRIFAAGEFATFDGTPAARVVRLRVDGTRDASFVSAAPHAIARVLPQEDGKLIVVAKATAGAADGDIVIRLNADGTRDSSWLARGHASAPGPVALTDSGRLWAAVSGNVSPSDNPRIPFGLAEYAPVPPLAIVTPPATVATTAGASATFSAAVSGAPPIQYQWYFNGNPVPGATSAALTLGNVTINNAGSYTVTATNDFGSVTSAAALLKGPNPLPVITTQPVSASALGGQSVTFSVSALSTGAASYQWRRNGVAIAGSTNATLVVAASLLYDRSVYDVRISDGLSVTTSEPAILRVTPASYPGSIAPDPAFDASFDAFDITGGSLRKFFRAADGRIYVVGAFSRLGGVRAWNVARLTADGAADPTFSAAVSDGAILAIDVQPDGRVLVGGQFTRLDGVRLQGIARLNVNGTLDTSFAPTADYRDVYCLKLQADGKVLVGGGFSPGPGLVRLQADGSPDSTFSNTSLVGGFYDIDLQPDGKIIVGGGFGGPAGTFNRLARLNGNGTLDTSFNPGAGANFTVEAVRVLSDGRVLAGGHFTVFNGAAAGKIVRLTSSGGVDPAWSAGSGFTMSDATAGVEQLDVQTDGKIVAIGGFLRFNNVSRFAMARLMPDGALDGAFVPPLFSGSVIAIATLANGNILTGGSFTGNLMLLGNNGGALSSPLAGTLFSPTETLVFPLPDGKVMAAGSFSHVNGAARSSVARVNANGTLDQTFNAAGTGASGTIRSMVVQPDGRVILGGDFEQYNGTQRPYLARINLDGSLDSSFQPDITGYYFQYFSQIYPLSQGRVLVYCANNSLQPYFLRLNADGSRDAMFRAPEGNGPVSAIAAVAEQSDGRLILGGTFTRLGETTVNRIIRLLPDGSLDPSFAAVADDAVNSIVLNADGRILIAGAFTSVNQSPVVRVARLNSNGSLDPSFNAGGGPNGAVRQIRLQGDGKLIISGTFTTVSGASNTAFLARLHENGSVDGTFIARRVNGAPRSFEFQDDGGLLLSGGYAESGAFQQYGVIRLAFALPIISTQPQNQTVVVGATATLSVVASSAVSYQWRHNGTDIPGATGSTLVVQNIQFADGGTYTVVVTNGAGSIESAAVALTVNPAIAPTLVGQLANRAVAVGGVTTFSVVVSGSEPLTYQWRKDGVALAAGTTRSLTLSNVQTTDAGAYSVKVSNVAGEAVSSAATLTVLPAGVAAGHQLARQDYEPGPVTVVNTFTYSGTAPSLKWHVLLPAGFSLAGSAGDEGSVKPAAGATDLAEWSWTTAPSSPVTFTYTLNPPVTPPGSAEVTALVTFQPTGDSMQFLAQPDPLNISRRHSADTDGDGRISLFELTRVIELYNTRNGTSRTGCYQGDPNGEDGFAPNAARALGSTAALARYHTADTRGATSGAPRDGAIDLFELTRVIELYNYRVGTTRTGQYHAQAGTEDGFAPGP